MQSTEKVMNLHDSSGIQSSGFDACIPIALFEEEAYTTGQIAEWLNVDAGTIRREIGRGRLQALRVGSDYRIFRSALVRYLRNSLTGAGGACEEAAAATTATA